MRTENLSIEWAKYRYRLKSYEKKFEDSLRSKYPEMEDHIIDDKVTRAIDREFSFEAKKLVATHLSLSPLIRCQKCGEQNITKIEHHHLIPKTPRNKSRHNHKSNHHQRRIYSRLII